MFHIIYHQGNINLKKRDTTTHLLEWSESRTWTTSNSGKDVEQLALSSIAGGNAKWYSHSGDQLGSFYKTKHALSYDPKITFLGIYPRS